MGTPHSDTGIEDTLIPVSIWRLPYGNGDSHIPIWEQNLTVSIWGSKINGTPYRHGDYRTRTGTHSYTGMVQSPTHSRTEFVPIWGFGKKSPWGRFHMGIPITIWGRKKKISCGGSPFQKWVADHMGINTYTLHLLCSTHCSITTLKLWGWPCKSTLPPDS